MFKRAAMAVCLVAAAAGLARAGYKSGSTVAVSTSGSYAHGSLGNVRNSSDTVEYIQCTVWNLPDGSFGNCSAKDANGNTAVCNIPSGLFTSAFSLGTDSYLQFFWNSSGDCTEIDTAVGSHYAPKQL